MNDTPRPQIDVYRFIQEVRQKDKKIDTEIDPRDKAFHVLAATAEWKALKEYIESRVKSLRSLLEYETSGKSLEDIGMKFLIADLASAELENIIDKVENGRKAVEAIEEERTV